MRRIIEAMISKSHEHIVGLTDSNDYEVKFSYLELCLSEAIEKEGNDQKIFNYAQYLKDNSNSRRAYLIDIGQYRKSISELKRELSELLNLDKLVSKSTINEVYTSFENVDEIKKLFSVRNNHFKYNIKHKINATNSINNILEKRNNISKNKNYDSFSDYRCYQVWQQSCSDVEKSLIGYYSSIESKINEIEVNMDCVKIDNLRSQEMQKYEKYRFLNEISSFSKKFTLSQLLNVAIEVCYSLFGIKINYRVFDGFIELFSKVDNKVMKMIILSIESSGTYTALSSNDIYKSSYSITYLNKIYFETPISMLNAKTFFHEFGHLLNMALVNLRGINYHALFFGSSEVCSQYFEQIGIKHLNNMLNIPHKQTQYIEFMLVYDLWDELKQVEFALIDLMIHKNAFKLSNQVNYPYYSYTKFTNTFARILFFNHLFGGELESMYSIYPLNNKLARTYVENNESYAMYTKYFLGYN